tara:strand:- start:542 stop:769 length:228 start_codon:yes stop_codon:yes gene_type:complete
MDRKNILNESQLDNILKVLRKGGKSKEADKIENNKNLQKNTLKIQKKIDDLNKNGKNLEKLFGIKYKNLTMMDFI